MEDIPVEWVAKIFTIFSDWFADKWTDDFKKPHYLDICTNIWKNGMLGLSYEDVRHGLKICKQMAKNGQLPPTVIEFYHYSKGIRVPYIPPKKERLVADVDKAKSSLSQMRQTIGKSHGTNQNAHSDRI
jgi:hypothetical protein